MKVEHTDRGAGQNSLGKGTQLTDMGFMVRPLLGDAPVDSSIRDFPTGGSYPVEQIRVDLTSKHPVLGELTKNVSYQGYSLDKDRRPTFKYRIDGIEYQQTITPLESGQLHHKFTFSKSTKPIRFLIDQDKVHVSSSVGTISGGILSLPAGTTELELQVKRLP